MFEAAFRKEDRYQKIGPLNDRVTVQPKSTSSTRILAQQDEMLKSSKANNLIIVLVGAEKTPFQLSRDQICKESAYFATCLGPRWDKEGTKTEVYLDDIDADIFKLISRWLAEGKICKYGSSRHDNELQRRNYWRSMVQLYLVAEYLAMPCLMNAIVDTDALEHRDRALRRPASDKDQRSQRYARVWTLQAFVEALQYDVTHTPYYNLMLDSCIYGLRFGVEKDSDSIRRQLAYIQDLYPEVMVDFTLRSLRREGSNNRWNDENPWYNDFSNYHVHAKGEKCGNLPGT